MVATASHDSTENVTSRPKVSSYRPTSVLFTNHPGSTPTLVPSAWVTNALPPYAVDGTGTNNTVTVPSGSADYFRLIYPPR